MVRNVRELRQISHFIFHISYFDKKFRYFVLNFLLIKNKNLHTCKNYQKFVKIDKKNHTFYKEETASLSFIKVINIHQAVNEDS